MKEFQRKISEYFFSDHSQSKKKKRKASEFESNNENKNMEGVGKFLLMYKILANVDRKSSTQCHQCNITTEGHKKTKFTAVFHSAKGFHVNGFTLFLSLSLYIYISFTRGLEGALAITLRNKLGSGWGQPLKNIWMLFNVEQYMFDVLFAESNV
jgi:hypothetical protein